MKMRPASMTRYLSVANTRHVMGLEATTKEPFIDTRG